MRLYQSGQKPVEKVQLAIRVRDAQDQLKIDETKTIGVDQFATAGQQIADTTTTPVTSRPGRSGGVPVSGVSASGTQPSDKFANLSLRTADVAYEIPMSKLSPGPHLLTLEATLGTTTIRRDVRFEVK
jgi:hypothetical protein